MGEYIQRKNFGWNTANRGNKTADIKAAIERKEKSIKSYTDAKSLAIAVSSAFNSASDLCNIMVSKDFLPNPATKDGNEKYWETHAKLYDDFVNGFLDAQEDAQETMKKTFYEAPKKVVPAVSYAREKALQDVGQDIKEGQMLIGE